VEDSNTKAKLMGEQKRKGIKMKIRFNISENEFWNLAQERGWMTKADVFKGREIGKMVGGLNHDGYGLSMLEMKLEEVAKEIEEHSAGVTKDEIASAMLTIIRMYTE
jgi:hypothetical protein